MRLTLNDQKWRAFFIGGDEGVFDISASASGIDKKRIPDYDSSKLEEIPYVTRSNLGNGINKFVGDLEKYNYFSDEGGVITIGLDTQTIFFQPYKFYTGQNIQILRHENLNRFSAGFLIPLLKIQMKKFNWGSYGATLGRLFRTKIMLPVTDKGQPDWLFMEDYIKSIFSKKQNIYEKYATKAYKRLAYKKIVPLEEKEWKEFFLKDIFEDFQRGKRITKANQVSGNIPYVSSTAGNNGIDNFIENSLNVRIFPSCLTIANSGCVGVSFYQPHKFVASDHVTHLKHEGFNKFIYLFMATQTKKLSEKYNFNREINDRRISRERVLLPVNTKGTPDYSYMEQYMMNLEWKKRKQYFDHESSYPVA